MDLEGMDRVDGVDMGAFENQKILYAVFNLSKSFGQLDIFPNPVQDDLNFVFESSYNGELEVKIIDIKGTEIVSFSLEKNAEKLSSVYSVARLPKGIYQLIISNGTAVDKKAFVK